MRDNIWQPLSLSVPAKGHKLEIILYLTRTFAKVCIVNIRRLKWFLSTNFSTVRTQLSFPTSTEHHKQKRGGNAFRNEQSVLLYHLLTLCCAVVLTAHSFFPNKYHHQAWDMENKKLSMHVQWIL